MIKFGKNKQEETQELGFGSAVSETNRGRLINKDGSFNVHREGLNFFTSLSMYHHLLTTTWPRFIGWASLGYFLMNLVFAFAYLLFGKTALGGFKSGDFLDELSQAFFFSVQTSSTIGYGHITPVSNGANILVTLESFTGLLGIALVTGLVFARFSRPTANILFSKNALISPYKDISGFMFRIANARKNQLIELSAQLHFSHIVVENGKQSRKIHRLELELKKIPFFPLTWTIVHAIDKKSPLYRVSPEQLVESNAEFLILLTGLDDTFNQTVFSRSSYKAEEVIFGAKFRRIYNQAQQNGPVVVDLGQLNDYDIKELPA